MNTTTEIIDTFVKSRDAFRISTAVLGILIYIAGFIGNFLSLLLFTEKKLREVSTSFIFLLLNIFGTIHLLALLVEFFDTILQIELVSNDIFRCQFILWLQNATRTICSFLATTVSIDRFIRSKYPIKARIWCTSKNVIKLCLIYVLFSILFYAFFFDPLNVFDSNRQCSFPYKSAFRTFALSIMPPIRFILICVIPNIIMVGCGGRMLLNIRQAKNRIFQRRSVHNRAIAIVDVPIPNELRISEQIRRQTVALDQMLLLMVLANVIAYTITQIPFNIYTIYYGFETSDDFTSYLLLRAFFLMWSSIYFGIGFYLFSLTSPHFRKQFITKMKKLSICCQ